jgi:predicted O-methyltransferase YrrM
MEQVRRQVSTLRLILTLVPRLRGLPWRVTWFYLRAWTWALLHGDPGGIVGSARPEQIAALLELAAGRRHVVELGTGKAWTALALALAERDRKVISYDTIVWPTRDRYLGLVPPDVRGRVEFRVEEAEQGAAAGDPPVEVLFLDSSHELEETIKSFQAWSPFLSDGGTVAFHDYGNPDYPGVEQAVQQLALEGETLRGMFVWRRGSRQPDNDC